MRFRVLALSAVGLASAFGSCSWSDVPAGAVYACDQDVCPEGHVCEDRGSGKKFCFPAETPNCTAQTCASLARNCGEVDDGCGAKLQCGSCTSPEVCGGAGIANLCACRPAASSDACADAGATCGELTLPDGCGVQRVYACGGCDGGSCFRNACCQTPPAAAACADAGHACGPMESRACGKTTIVSCGNCPAFGSCEVTGFAAVCVACVTEGDEAFCARQGATCGSLNSNDNCGTPRTVNCGVCDDGGCGSDAGANLCECLPPLMGCVQNNQCCTNTCGKAGLCCAPAGAFCNDSSECCGTGDCVAGFCALPPGDGGLNDGRD